MNPFGPSYHYKFEITNNTMDSTTSNLGQLNNKTHFQWAWIRRVLALAAITGILYHAPKFQQADQTWKFPIDKDFLIQETNISFDGLQHDKNTSHQKNSTIEILSFPKTINNVSEATKQSQPNSEKRGQNKKKDQAKDLFSNDTFLNTTLRNPALPECKSGNEFLSPDGGVWVEVSTMEKNKNLDLRTKKNHAICRTKNYQDRYVWRANCSIPDIPSALKNGIKIIKMLLVGDSLHGQFMQAIEMQKGIVSDKVSNRLTIYGVDVHFESLWNPMLTSINLESSVCPTCNNIVNKKVYKNQLTPLSENDFYKKMKGYDYIFYNEFAHFVKPFFIPLEEEFRKMENNATNLTAANTVDIFVREVFDYFERQMTKKAELIAKTGAKAYFRTAYPQAYQSETIYGNISQRDTPLHSPVKSLPFSRCEVLKDDKYGGTCFSTVNDIASRAFMDHGLSVLDAGKMLSQRIDAHPASINATEVQDFLHFCQPGPMSVLVAGVLTEIYAQEKIKTK